MPAADRTPHSASFEVGKGRQKVLTLNEQQVAHLLDPAELLIELEKGFGALARGEIQCPPRPQIQVPGKGFSLSMAAWQPGMQICVKIVNVFDGNLELGLPNHLAVINLFDSNTGAVTCVMDATHITAVRTAASAMLSHKLLSRPESRIATILGAGVQAREHLRLLPLIRNFDEILISSLDSDHAEGLAKLHSKARAVTDLEESVRRSDVICLTTHSPAPVIQAEWVKPGTHAVIRGIPPAAGRIAHRACPHQPIVRGDTGCFRAPSGRMRRVGRNRAVQGHVAGRGSQRSHKGSKKRSGNNGLQIDGQRHGRYDRGESSLSKSSGYRSRW